MIPTLIGLELHSGSAIQSGKIISETDTGIYDALNKGIKKSSGEVISILHSDDLYSNQNVLKNVYNKFLDH